MYSTHTEKLWLARKSREDPLSRTRYLAKVSLLGGGNFLQESVYGGKDDAVRAVDVGEDERDEESDENMVNWGDDAPEVDPGMTQRFRRAIFRNVSATS